MPGPSSNPMFSVIVPVYNHGKYIGAALDSLLAQTNPDWEAVVVNDGSTDDTPQIIDDYGRRDARIRPVHKPNGGAATALNEGLHLARGEWICWLSADDLFEPNKLELHREWFARLPEGRFFFTHFRHLHDDTGERKDPPPWRRIPETRWQLLEMLESNYLSGITMCVHRDALAAAGPFDPVMKYSQDYDMWVRLLVRHPAYYIDARTAVTRLHAAQYSNAQRAACFFDSAKIAIKFLNEHTFEQIFPLVDLSDPTQARLALDRAIDAAANPNAFLYKMGTHTALIGRIIEWLWNASPPAARPDLKDFFRRRAREYARRFERTDLGLLWKLAAAAATTGIGKTAAYCPVDAARTGETAYWHYAPEQASDAAELAAFLKRFDGLALPERGDAEAGSGLVGREIVWVAPEDCQVDGAVYGALRATLQMARQLSRRGARTALLGQSCCPVGAVDGVWFAGAADDVALKRLLAAAGGVDTVVAVGRNDVLLDSRSRRLAVYHHNMHPVPGGVSPRLVNRLGVRVICVSEVSKAAQAASGVRASLLDVVTNGYDRAVFSYDGEEHRVPHRLVFAGNVCDYKGIDLAVEAFRRIRQSVPDAELLVYGASVPWRIDSDWALPDGWSETTRLPDWSRLQRELPGLRYAGEAPPGELAEAFRAAGLLVMPSRSENFCLVSLEAQACGCLPVFPRTGGMPETIQEGTTGYLYKPNTADHLAATVVDLWTRGLPSVEQRHAAAQYASERFDWHQSGGRLARIAAALPPLTLRQRAIREFTRWHRRCANKLDRLRGSCG